MQYEITDRIISLYNNHIYLNYHEFDEITMSLVKLKNRTTVTRNRKSVVIDNNWYTILRISRTNWKHTRPHETKFIHGQANLACSDSSFLFIILTHSDHQRFTVQHRMTSSNIMHCITDKHGMNSYFLSIVSQLKITRSVTEFPDNESEIKLPDTNGWNSVYQYTISE